MTFGYISTQYHSVFDNLFQMVCETSEDKYVTGAIYNRLFEHDCDFCVEGYFGKDGELIYYPHTLDGIWLD